MSRVISGLFWAGLCSKPPGIPIVRRRKGAKAAGQKYEKALAAAMPWAVSGQWFEFADSNGRGHCQSDLVTRFHWASRPKEEFLVVLEAKLSDCEAAREQLRYLYQPVIAAACGEEPLAIAVVRHLTQLKSIHGEYFIHESLDRAVLAARARPKALHVLNWRERSLLGLGALVPQCVFPTRRAAKAA